MLLPDSIASIPLHPERSPSFPVNPQTDPFANSQPPPGVPIQAAPLNRSASSKRLLMDSLRRCVVCDKKFGFKRGLSLRRWRHVCHLCHRSFCDKHGRATHPGILPCGVPGSCICQLVSPSLLLCCVGLTLRPPFHASLPSAD